MTSVEHCRFNDQLYAIIVRASFREPGITFFSSPELSQQLAYMSHPKGKCIAPHRHNKVTREVHYTQEVLVIQKGKLQVDFYTEAEQYLESRVLSVGDIILLCSGVHGLKCLSRSKCSRSSRVPTPAKTTRRVSPRRLRPKSRSRVGFCEAGFRSGQHSAPERQRSRIFGGVHQDRMDIFRGSLHPALRERDG